jgi:hypothetical protein
MKNKKTIAHRNDQFANYSPVGHSFCEGKCQRQIVVTKEGPVIICDGCMRIVMDNREKTK